MSLRVPYLKLVLAAAAALLVGGAAMAQQPPPPPQQPPRPSAPAPRPQAAPAPAQTGSAMQRIDSARQLYQSGKLLESAEQLNAALDAIYGQLNQRYGGTLPAAPQGWQIDPPDPQRAALMGSAASGVRDYRPVGAPPPGQPPGQGQQGAMPPHMNARIVLDSDAVKAMQPLFGPQLPQGVPPTVKRMKIGDQDALVAYDPQRRAGEVSVLVGNKILLQVEGVGVNSADPMIATMRNWNVAELRRLAGI
jgi:hypothetical protein